MFQREYGPSYEDEQYDIERTRKDEESAMPEESPIMDRAQFKAWFDDQFYRWASASNTRKEHWLLSLLKFAEKEFYTGDRKS